MNGYVITNTRYLAPGANGLPELRFGCIAIRGDSIVEVREGPASGTEFESFQQIDGSDRIVSPGLINAHTHTVLLVLRGTVEDIEGNLVYQYMVPASYLLEPEERAAVARMGCLEAIRSGTTTIVDPLRFVDNYAQPMADSGIRLYLCESAADAVTTEIMSSGYRFDKEWGETFLKRTRALIETHHNKSDGRVQVLIAAHAPDNCSPWMLKQLKDLAEEYELKRTVHLSQMISEVEQVKSLHNKTSTEYLRDNEWLDDELLAVHWSFCTESDVEILASHDVHFVHCPASMSAKGPHRLPIKAILESGINIMLGTDNMTEDMFHAMKMAQTIHRGAYGRSVTPSPRQVFNYATLNAAKALGRDDLGHISIGAKADLTFFDRNAPVLNPHVSIVSNLVHYGHPGTVTDVMVDGEFVMRDRAVLTMNEADVLEKAQNATDAMWSRFQDKITGIPLPYRDPV